MERSFTGVVSHVLLRLAAAHCGKASRLRRFFFLEVLPTESEAQPPVNFSRANGKAEPDRTGAAAKPQRVFGQARNRSNRAATIITNPMIPISTTP